EGEYRSLGAVGAGNWPATRRGGAPAPLQEKNTADTQHAIAKAMISATNTPASPLLRAARPPTIVPRRIATKVALSTSALAAGNCSRRKWSGRIPYFIGPKSAARIPKPSSAINKSGSED